MTDFLFIKTAGSEFERGEKKKPWFSIYFDDGAFCVRLYWTFISKTKPHIHYQAI